jgi:tetratricopeptide (TPR) repeat protein
MEDLLTGLVPGLPTDVRTRILERAEGVPLYAVETVRMLLDRGLLVQDGPAYRLTGEVDALEVPETLHALIAARLDGLSADERRLLQDAAVLGKTFTKDAVAALLSDGADVEQLLTGLLRKEVLGVQADPRSPEHGQYGFLQDLVRHVAYETLSKRERRAKHLAAAEHLSSAFADEDEVVEVIASHYLAAHEAVPDADDAPEIKGKAQAMLVRAGERAESLAAAAEARRYFEQAAALTDVPRERAHLLHQAGRMAGYAGDPEGARIPLEQSIEIYEQEGDTHASARVLVALARVYSFTGRRDEAIERGEHALAVLSADEPGEELALMAARLAAGYWFGGNLDRSLELAELALDVAEARGFYEPLVTALRAKGSVAESRGRHEEAEALFKHALTIALEHDLSQEATVLYFVLSDVCFRRDRYTDALGYLDEALAFAQRLGDRPKEWGIMAERTYPLFMLGRWDDVLAVSEEFTQEQIDAGGVMISLLQSAVEVHVQQGHLDDARRVAAMFSRLEGSTDLQDLTVFHGSRGAQRRAEGKLHEALADADATIEAGLVLGVNQQSVKQAIIEGVEAALELGEAGKVEELLALVESVPPGSRSRYLDAHARRVRARLERDEAKYDEAASIFRRLSIPFWLAVTLLEKSELTGDEESLAEAREIFEGLEATPWLERAAMSATARVPA